MEKGDPYLAILKKTLSVQDVLYERSTDGMFSPQGFEPPRVSTRMRHLQETNAPPNEKSELFSDIATFLGTRGSSLAIIENPLVPGSAPYTQSGPGRNNGRPISIIIAYDPADERHKNHIIRDLKTLLRQRYNITWDAYDVTEPSVWVTDVDDPLKEYDLVLLLVSPEFVSLDFCYGESVCRAVDRHMRGIWVSPILLRPCLWGDTPFSETNILPRHNTPVTEWPREDQAFLDIVNGIKRALEYIGGRI